MNMKRHAAVKQSSLVAGLCASLALAASPALADKDPPPQVSPDGLHLTKSTKNRVVYVKPGATFSQFSRLAILDPLVEFEKDWQKDYNRSRTGLEGRVSDEDVEKMKERLAAEFKKVFVAELQGKGGYEVVNVAGPDVLVLRPALINVEVNAPDVMTAGIEHTVVRSAGQMTLYLELWDSASNTLLARVMDAQADSDSMAQVGGSVTNKAAADRILRDWAGELRERLDEVRAKPVTP
jgi:RNase P/RNase MRP subunit p29